MGSHILTIYIIIIILHPAGFPPLPLPGLGYRGSKDLDDLVPSKAAAGGPRCHGWLLLFFFFMAGNGWLRLVTAGNGWLRLVTAGNGWLRLVTAGYGWLLKNGRLKNIENESGGLTLIIKKWF